VIGNLYTRDVFVFKLRLEAKDMINSINFRPCLEFGGQVLVEISRSL
jgi:hypothetical protein